MYVLTSANEVKRGRGPQATPSGEREQMRHQRGFILHIQVEALAYIKAKARRSE